MKTLLRILMVLLLLPCLVAAGFVYLRPNRIVSKSEAIQKIAVPTSHFTIWRGASVHYTDEGSGIPVLMIHGLGGSFHNFDKLNALLPKDKYRCIRVDLPGFGLSDFPKVTEGENYVNDYRDYLNFMIDELHLDSVYVIGNSMGGGIGWLMAGDHPDKVKRLVLLGAAGYDTKEVAHKLWMFKYSGLDKLFERGAPLFFSRHNAEMCFCDKSKISQQAVFMNNISTNKEGNIPFLFQLARANNFPDSALIQRVACPTLIIWGRQDRIVPVEHAERFHRDIKNSSVLYFDSCGHVPMIEKSTETAAAVTRFFEKKRNADN
ncbi:MAG: alpha/beta hydrolase [Chitinophagales bacterium]